MQHPSKGGRQQEVAEAGKRLEDLPQEVLNDVLSKMPLQDAAMTMALNKALFKGVVSEFSAAFQLIKCMSHPLMGRDESSFRAYQAGLLPPPLACQGANQLATILNAGFRANRRVIAPVGYGCVYMPARLMEDASSHLGPLIILFSLDSLGNMWGFKYDFKRWRYTQTILVAMKDGTVYKTAGWTSGMEKQMERMAANPRECLHSWMRSNCCVFCLRTLTYIYDVFHGFGGNCGRRYGLDAVMGE
eukprot:jgi/Mesvir1/17049/Mv16578-RA.1